MGKNWDDMTRGGADTGVIEWSGRTDTGTAKWRGDTYLQKTPAHEEDLVTI